MQKSTINEIDFINFIKVKQGLAPRSVKLCRIKIKLISRWLAGRQISKILLEQLIGELQDAGLKNNSLNSYIFVFRQYREYCEDRGLDTSFFDGFKNFKKNKPEIIIFTLEEIEAILSVEIEYKKFRGIDGSFLSSMYKTLTMFIAYTGCRPSEAFELKIKNLDISNGSAQFIDTKTNENRTVYFTDPLKNRLKLLVSGKQATDLVFTNLVGNKISEQEYNKDLKRRAIEAGVIKRANPYNFRHSYITHQLEYGVPIQVVASLVGHKDIQTTYKNYMHLADQTLRKAAMRHPLLQKNVDPIEIIQQIKESIESFNLRSDNRRFYYSINELSNGLTVQIEIKES